MNARVPGRDHEAGARDRETEGQSEFDALLRSRAQTPSAVRRERTGDSAARISRIVSLDAGGAIGVAVPGWASPVPARLAAPISGERILAAIATGQPAVLLFEEGDPMRPIVVGLLEEGPHPATGESAREDAGTGVIEADVDGKRVRITARDEIVLQCGEASITLRRNGRLVIRGTHVESASEGTNRIKGGQVRIN